MTTLIALNDDIYNTRIALTSDGSTTGVYNDTEIAGLKVLNAQEFRLLRAEHEARYSIYLHTFGNTPRRSQTGLTLTEAKAFCSDPQSSSQTCTNKAGAARSRRHAAWFYGYEKE